MEGCFHTCIRASGRLMEKASLSLMLTSGYCVCWKAFSRACSWDKVKAVRLRRCFCWLPYRASKMSSSGTETHKSVVNKTTNSLQHDAKMDIGGSDLTKRVWLLYSLILLNVDKIHFMVYYSILLFNMDKYTFHNLITSEQKKLPSISGAPLWRTCSPS